MPQASAAQPVRLEVALRIGPGRLGTARPIDFMHVPGTNVVRSDAVVAVEYAQGKGRRYARALEVSFGPDRSLPRRLELGFNDLVSRSFRDLAPRLLGWADRRDIEFVGELAVTADRTLWDSDYVQTALSRVRIDAILATVPVAYGPLERPKDVDGTADGTRWRLLEAFPSAGLAAGDILICRPYWLDPGDKLEVLRRESDGFRPSRTLYRHDVEAVTASATTRVQIAGLSEPADLPVPTQAELDAGIDNYDWALEHGVCPYDGGVHLFPRGSRTCRRCGEDRLELVGRSASRKIFEA